MHIVMKQFHGLLTQMGLVPNFFCHPGIEPKPFYIFQSIWQYAYRFEAISESVDPNRILAYFLAILELNLNPLTFFKQYGNMHIISKQFQNLMTQI